MSRCVALLVLVLVAGMVPTSIYAKDGALSMGDVQKLRSSFVLDEDTRAIMNAVANNELREIALDQETLKTSNMYFSNKIETKGITDQNSTGRCWMYAGFNMLRPKVIEAHNLDDFEFSEAHLFFWDKVEKANLFLEEMIEHRKKDADDRLVEWLFQHPLPDGGQWNMFVELVDKYGVVPSYVMPENEQSKASRIWNGLISRKLRKDALELRSMHERGQKEKDLRARKMEMLEEVYRMLAVTLGNPPTEFVWRYEDKDGNVAEPKTYTPKQFYDEVVGVDLSPYVYMLSTPLEEYGRMYEIEFDRDMYEKPNMSFANVPPEDLKEYTLKSVLDGTAVWFGCDVGKEHHRDEGTGVMRTGIYRYDAVYGVDLSMTKEERLLTRDGIPSHAMVLTGVDMDGNKPVKWLVENSWGTDYGDKGMWMLSDSWFDNYVYGAVVHRDYVAQKVLDILDQKPTTLPPWDPMFDAATWR